MTAPAKQKGDRAEREAAELLNDELGVLVRRRLGAGRRDDMGDLELGDGFSCAVQVADWQDVVRALVAKVYDAVEQADRAGLDYGVAMLRIKGGTWRVAMDVETFCNLLREASA